MSLAADPHGNRPGLTDLVRIALIGWQRTLRCDGVPITRRLRRSPHLGAAPWYVVQLLTESSSFQTASLLTDLDQHLRWLARSDAQSPWSEAMLIDAMVEAALLVRDPEFLEIGRRRLSALLDRQHAEGWFPEHGGADVGRLSLTVDALARLFRLGNWDQLREPLQRACQFLVHAVHPDGSSGGCCNSCGTRFMSPYGVERLAQCFPEALHLAHLCRRRCRNHTTRELVEEEGAIRAVYGAAMCMAASHAARKLPAPPASSTTRVGRIELLGAGLVVHATNEYHAVVNVKTGGALHVRWRDGSTLEDRGIVVVYPHTLRASAHRDEDARPSITGDSINCRGRLKRVSPRNGGILEWLRRTGRAWVRFVDRLRQVARQPGPTDGSRKRDPKDRFQRTITFGVGWIRIRDRVRCRQSCETIICQPPAGLFPRFALSGSGTDALGLPPQYLGGGRDVDIIRVYRNGELIDPPIESAEPGAHEATDSHATIHDARD